MPKPELVFGLVGPIGVNMDQVQGQLAAALLRVGYRSEFVHLSKIMASRVLSTSETEFDQKSYEAKIQDANNLRESAAGDSVMAALAVSEIRDLRKRLHIENGRNESDDLSDEPLSKIAYIVRQLKRPEEVRALQKVYGQKFVQLSIALDEKTRIKNLSTSLGERQSKLTPEQCEETARSLVKIDNNESEHLNGQRVSKIFHLGDAFISGRNEDTIRRTTDRFIEAFFGKNSISPNKDEFGSYLAKAASLRSIDPARQVGAAIVSPLGDLVSIGCNEVPKFGGGNYWSDDNDPQRDMEVNSESNKVETKRIIHDFLTRLEKNDLLVKGTTAAEIFSMDELDDALDGSLIQGITEYGRMTHAEMSAITDAARLGRAVKGATLYVTTFPCHNCAKHVVASGIQRVVFIEPYAKSRAETLHNDSISIGIDSPERVVFEHFEGISPRRYRDIFEKGSRRSPDGRLAEWSHDEPAPQIRDLSSNYGILEATLVKEVIGKIA